MQNGLATNCPLGKNTSTDICDAGEVQAFQGTQESKIAKEECTLRKLLGRNTLTQILESWGVLV